MATVLITSLLLSCDRSSSSSSQAHSPSPQAASPATHPMPEHQHSGGLIKAITIPGEIQVISEDWMPYGGYIRLQEQCENNPGEWFAELTIHACDDPQFGDAVANLSSVLEQLESLGFNLSHVEYNELSYQFVRVPGAEYSPGWFYFHHDEDCYIWFTAPERWEMREVELVLSTLVVEKIGNNRQHPTE